MTGQIIDGKQQAASIRAQIKDEIESTKLKPCLAIVQVGDRPDSNLYVRMKKRSANEIGIEARHHLLPGDITQSDLETLVDSLNVDPHVHGIIVQLPLPKGLDENSITSRVAPSKDVDGFGPHNIGEIHRRYGNPLFEPCTPRGIISLLKSHPDVDLNGCSALVIGRSDIVGNPVAALLQKCNATVSVAHSRTPENVLANLLGNADVVVVAVGVAGFVSKKLWEKAQEIVGSTNMKKPVVIDVGTNYIPDATRKSGKRCVGDVDFDAALPYVKAITPVPGGVGPMTVAMLLQNTFIAAQRQLTTSSNTQLRRLTPVPSDAEISSACTPTEITEIAAIARVPRSRIIPYGSTKAKIDISNLPAPNTNNKRGKYIVVTGITPTPLGEGKSTTTIGVAQALGAHCGRLAIATVRQPSMGPTFGVKGGAAGGGYAQVVPMEDFNLHLTGDLHAVSITDNLLAAAIDTRIFHESTQGDAALFRRLVPGETFGPVLERRLKKLGINKTNPTDLTEYEKRRLVRLDIDPETITWKRVVDVNDRFLREITIGESATEKGMTRKTGFDITVASEVMAILALSNSPEDMRERLGNIVVATSKSGEPVTCDDIGCAGAMMALMKDAINPNMMQTLEKTPVLVHAGPFANISIGASSVLADKVALHLTSTNNDSAEAGYVITEAGFDFTMGGERFLNIKARTSNLIPDAVVIVATVRALKVHGGGSPIKPGQSLPQEYREENLGILERGCANLAKHIENAKSFNLPVIVAVNKFVTDTDAELELVRKLSIKAGAEDAIVASHWSDGGEGAVDLANGIIKVCESDEVTNSQFKFTYPLDIPIEEKIKIIATKMYNAVDVEFAPLAKEKLKLYTSQGYDNLPICIAKTQYSLSHDPNLKGVPSGYTLPIRDIKVAAGAGYLFALAGDIMTIPGLPTRPGYMNIEVEDQHIKGMF